MKLSPELRLLLLIIGAFLTGLLVIWLNPGYRLETNRESNRHYYAESPETGPTPAESGAMETSRDLQDTIEF